jgi:hypothetical protein
VTPPQATKDSTKSATDPAAKGKRRPGVPDDDYKRRLDDIEAYLTDLAVALEVYDWGSSPLKVKGPGGQGVGSNPPKWPP